MGIENLDKGNIEIEDDQVEIEIVDDTPEEDRGRTPIPEEVKKEIEEDDEAEKYSAKVEKRIAQQKRAYHDERRAKEAAERERDEAVKIAQMAYTERMELQKKLEQGEAWALEQGKRRVAVEIEQAKKKYQDAYDAGDAQKLVEAQQAMNFATLEFDRLHHYTPQHTLQNKESVVNTKPEIEPKKINPPPDDRATEWADNNKWFGVDRKKTALALAIHEELVQDEGIYPNTDPDTYYEKLNSRIKEVFPDKTERKQPPATVVAGVGRSSKSKKVTLTQTQVAIARKLGVTNEHYARELLKLQGEE